MELKDRIIIAVDVSEPRAALEIVKELSYQVGGFKFGLEFIHSMRSNLLTSSREFAIEQLDLYREIYRLSGYGEFTDAKLDDIPNTIEGAVRAIARLNGKIINIHAAAGMGAMKAAVKNKGNSETFAVTVLTSHDDTSSLFSFGELPKRKVEAFARAALNAGINGIICSPQELEHLAQFPEFDRLKKGVPGIRPLWAQAGDQKRTMTPAEAIKLGADFLVIGRPILKPPAEIGSRKKALDLVLEEVAEAMK